MVAYQASRRVVWCEASHPRATFRPTISANLKNQAGVLFSIARLVWPFLPLPIGSHLRGGTCLKIVLKRNDWRRHRRPVDFVRGQRE